MARTRKDLASPEVKAALQESFKLAEALGLNGTPSYVIGDNVCRRGRARGTQGEGQHFALRQAER